MNALDQQLHDAAGLGDFQALQACLGAGANCNAHDAFGDTALHWAARGGYADCVAALLAAGAPPAAHDEYMFTPMHYAAGNNHPAVLRQLLAAAGPAAAQRRDCYGNTPLQLALRRAAPDAAHILLEQGPQQPASELLDVIATGSFDPEEEAPLLHTMLAAHQPLTPAEWARLPTPCPGLGAALPAVLQRSGAEAGLLVRHLPPADQARLRTAALCLERAQRRRPTRRSPRLPPLPTPIVWRLLSLSVAD